MSYSGVRRVVWYMRAWLLYIIPDCRGQNYARCDGLGEETVVCAKQWTRAPRKPFDAAAPNAIVTEGA